ncbi:MAG: hypothetical protein HYU84_10440 [Chloroflexi bacterium]|nr:hypothetical protein [Chloroflexota bacterium]MBI3168675.1 hypothetical protein [Chloroflexota bacterium]
MRTLLPDEKASTVFVYTESMLIRGDLILRENMRVSIWLRTQGVPNFLHLNNVQMIQLAGSPPKNFTKNEAFIPTPEIIGFHLAPPAHDPLDYDASESNRKMEPVHLLAGSFELTAKLRVSTSADFAASLDVMNASWMSLYEAEITNPHLPQLKVTVPMLLVRPNKVTISL